MRGGGEYNFLGKYIPLPLPMNVTEDNKGWREDGFLFVLHDDGVALEVPHLLGDGVHLDNKV